MDRNDYYGGESSSLNLKQVTFSHSITFFEKYPRIIDILTLLFFFFFEFMLLLDSCGSVSGEMTRLQKV